MEYYTVPQNSIEHYAMLGKVKSYKLMKARGIKPEERHMIWRQVEPLRNEHRSNRAKHRMARAAWRDLADPLVWELQRVRVSLRRKVTNESPARYEAYDTYYFVLSKLLARFQKHAMAGFSPKDKAKELHVPNEGAHWVDWLSDEAKQLVIELFDAVPFVRGRITKRPFSRDIPPTNHEKRKARLTKAALKELATAQALLTANPDDERNSLKVRNIRSALSILDVVSPTTNLPRTWHGLLTLRDD